MKQCPVGGSVAGLLLVTLGIFVVPDRSPRTTLGVAIICLGATLWVAGRTFRWVPVPTTDVIADLRALKIGHSASDVDDLMDRAREELSPEDYERLARPILTRLYEPFEGDR